MSAIKIARGYGWMIGGKLFSSWRDGGGYKDNVPVHIIYGLSDAEAAALPEIMERERGVCEWEGGYLFTDCRHLLHGAVFEFCPSCGRRVKLK